MFKDILEVHRRIYYESGQIKNNHNKQNIPIIPSIEDGSATMESKAPNLSIEHVPSVENRAVFAPKWNMYEKEKTQVNALESFSDELEFYARRYGGGLR